MTLPDVVSRHGGAQSLHPMGRGLWSAATWRRFQPASLRARSGQRAGARRTKRRRVAALHTRAWSAIGTALTLILRSLHHPFAGCIFVYGMSSPRKAGRAARWIVSRLACQNCAGKARDVHKGREARTGSEAESRSATAPARSCPSPRLSRAARVLVWPE